MIVCPNCNHQNPTGAVQCEACYTPLPATMACSNCGAKVQVDASFCGQCGFNLKAVSLDTPVPVTPGASPSPALPADLGATAEAEPQSAAASPSVAAGALEPNPVVVGHGGEPEPSIAMGDLSQASDSAAPPAGVGAVAAGSKPEGRTQLQQQTARLLHTQTNTSIDLPQNLSVIHLGKPNDRIPPDIDVSGFPNSEIVSRIHADIRIEGEAYYIEDVGSSNGTYINNLPLPIGNRHRLRPGDRIALGKGDKVTFLFQLS